MVTNMGVMSVIIGLVIGVIGLVIVNETIASANFTSGSLLDTVTGNIPILYRFAAPATSEGNCGWAPGSCCVLGGSALKSVPMM